MEFKDWIREARIRKKWSQSMLSRRADVPENTIRRLESGATVPRWQTLVKLVAALDEAPPMLGSYGETLDLLSRQVPIRSTNSEGRNNFPTFVRSAA